MNNQYGRYHDVNANWKHNSKNPIESFKNSITRRGREISESTVPHMQLFPLVSQVLPLLWPASNR